MKNPVPRPVIADPTILAQGSEKQEALFKFYERDIEDRLVELLDQMGLALYQDPKTGKNGRQYNCGIGRIDLLCVGRNTNDFVIIELKKGEAPNVTLLQILRYMSWVRQNLAEERRVDVKGIILTEAADSGLVEIVKEVSNVYIKHYKVSISLV